MANKRTNTIFFLFQIKECKPYKTICMDCLVLIRRSHSEAMKKSFDFSLRKDSNAVNAPKNRHINISAEKGIAMAKRSAVDICDSKK